MTRCMNKGVVTGSVVGAAVGFAAWLVLREKTTWAMVKRIGVPVGLGCAVGILAGFAGKTSCEGRRLSPSYR